MKLNLYQVDAFTNRIFGGNPAAICPLKEWLPTELMQKIALENNLSETAFFVPQDNGFHIRWFTPAVEVDLCGHATLATGHVLFQHLGFEDNLINFKSRSGHLSIKKEGENYVLDFPKDNLKKVEPPSEIKNSLNLEIKACYEGREDFLVLVDSLSQVEKVSPDFGILKKLNARGVIVTAKGNEVDFVSRCFFPAFGIDEDPVTGSAHTTLTPFWAEQLNKSVMTAKQISARGGDLICKLNGDRVEIGGRARTYLIGEIEIPD